MQDITYGRLEYDLIICRKEIAELEVKIRAWKEYEESLQKKLEKFREVKNESSSTQEQ